MVLEFCLPASELSRDECDKIMRPVVKNFLAKNLS